MQASSDESILLFNEAIKNGFSLRRSWTDYHLKCNREKSKDNMADLV